MNNDIFISVGRTSSDKQEKFVSAVEDYIRSHGLVPRAVGRNDFAADNPLKFIQNLMRRCAGTVIIAFERTQIIDGVERRGALDQKIISNQVIPTVWNQIEAAMAYILGHPMLVIVEDGARTEGLLEGGFDWWVQRLPLTPASLGTKEFVGVFADWKSKVENAGKKRKVVDVENLTLGALLSSLKVSHLCAIIGALAALAGGAFYLGTLFSTLPK